MTAPMTAAQEMELQLRLACAELKDRLRTGEPVRAESMFAKFAAFAGDADAALEVIYTEWLTREELGQAPAADELFERFPQFRERLRRLLEVHDALRHRGSLDTIAGASLRVDPAGAAPDVRHQPEASRVELPRVGPYEIHEELGRGGMGVVYRARHVSLNRLVALKRIRRGEFAEPAELARFHMEAQTAASLHHPNIVQIYEVGEHDGLPYLALELVNGPSLADRLAQGPLPPRDAAALVETLARAMDHAHERGVIHRDLKPANILLQDLNARGHETRRGGDTETGRPREDTPISLSPRLPVSPSPCLPLSLSECVAKITDFGLAKQLNSAIGLTGSGAIMGTPSYMAPEQLDTGKAVVGPRADVYSLGAVLYESLTGRPPFLGDSPIATVDQVRRLEPASIRSMQPQCPHDLETICLKCLQKEPGQRYPSAAALADDLHRLLEGKPVHARPVGPLGRVLRWSRRKPVVAGLLAALVLSVVAGGAGIAWQWQRAADERTRTEAKAAEAKTAWDQAEANYAAATKASAKADARYEQNWSTVDRLADMTSEYLRQPRLNDKGRAALEELLGSYQRFLEEKSNDPAIRLRTARAFRRVGILCQLLGQFAKAEEAFRQACEVLEPLTASDAANVESRHDLIYCYLSKAFLERREPGPAPLRQALKTYEQAKEALYPWITAAPQNVAYRIAQVELLSNMGVTLVALGEHEQAAPMLEHALKIQRILLAAAPNNPQFRHAVAAGLECLSQVAQHRKLWAEAEDLCRQALTLEEKLVQDLPKSPDYGFYLAWIHSRMADIVKAQGKLADASTQLNAGIGVLDQVISGFPGVISFRRFQGELLMRATECSQAAGKRDEALTTGRRALAVIEQLAADVPKDAVHRRDLAYASFTCATLYKAQGQRAEALAAFQEALTLHATLPDDFPADPGYRNEIAWRSRDIANHLKDLGATAEAETAFRQAVTHFDRLATSHPDRPEYLRQVAATAVPLGHMLKSKKNHDAAKKAYSQAIEAHERLIIRFNAAAVDRYDLAWDLSHLSADREAAGLLVEAEEYLRRSLEQFRGLVEDFAGESKYRMYAAQRGDRLAKLLQKSGKRVEAIDATAIAAADWEKLIERVPDVKAHRICLADSQMRHADLLQRERRYADAAAALRSGVRFAPDYDLPLNALAWLLATCPDEKLRSPAEARDCALRATKASPRKAYMQNTLGVTLYRAKEYPGAIAALDESIRLRGKGTVEDWLFLAMANWQQGDKKTAQRFYEQAVEWMQKNKSNDEVQRFHTEAAALLGISPRRDDK